MVWADMLKFNFQRNKILNWTYYNILEDNETPIQRIIEQMDNYINLENDSYWRAKMTDEEREMKKHPNRSWRWIPNRLEKQRDELRYTLLDFIVGPENYSQGMWFWGKPCLNCNSSFDVEMEAIDTFRNSMVEELGSEYGGKESKEEYLIAKHKSFDRVVDEFGQEIADRFPYDSFQQGEIPTAPVRPYGMCSVCYQNAKEKMMVLIWDATGFGDK